MSRSINSVQLLGNLGQDAETRYTPTGVPCSKFSVATERAWKDGRTGDIKKETDWHNVVVWRREKLAEYLTKGTRVHVQGRLSYRKYEDRDGNTKYFTEIAADEIILLGGKDQPSSTSRREPPEAAERAAESIKAIDDDDVPF